MQIQVQGLLQFSPAVFPTAEVRESSNADIPLHNPLQGFYSMHSFQSFQKDLLGIQRLLNSSEFNLHQLTALLDCRSLHKVSQCSTSKGVFVSDCAVADGQVFPNASKVFLSLRIIWRLFLAFVMTV